MSENIFSLEQILDSVNEMRAELRECVEPGSSISIEGISSNTWESSEDAWFEDCEFDPR